MGHHLTDRGTRGLAAGIEARQLRQRVGWTEVGTLLGIEVRIHEQAMLDIVDAERHRLAKADGAEMTGDFHVSLVCLLDRCSQHLTAHVGVELEPGHALGGPVVHHATDRFRAVHLVHAAHTLAAGQVGTRDVHPRARRSAPHRSGACKFSSA